MYVLFNFILFETNCLMIYKIYFKFYNITKFKYVYIFIIINNVNNKL